MRWTFLLWWEWHRLSHCFTNAQQHKRRGVKNPSLARKRPHWDGETTETKYCLLLPFIFSSFPKLLLQQGDCLMDRGGKQRTILLRAAQHPRWPVLLRWMVFSVVDVAICHLWAHHSWGHLSAGAAALLCSFSLRKCTTKLPRSRDRRRE